MASRKAKLQKENESKTLQNEESFARFLLVSTYMLEIDIILIEIDNSSNIEISNLR